ncbi:vWA domain-containing protein [Epilithonimonas lactis]|uniref:von Willebrand factor A n=1 Tax=Epilithonimonas lactis TaxID=421072 RepID=A0A085B6T8_9FLAO|nr:VWA domain-containing protein [Epilithonimonas lactis]KFC18183.1 von Willebrand factor A [Epilithonimonas lactis]SER09312.1 Ca-activated chloride channel family protein [Epilithonimonas lactis]
MENQDIDKMFSEAGKSAEEKPTFPNFEKVWENVEEKLDKKEQRKRIIPLWLPYGMVAGLALTFGVLYFVNDKETKIEPQIASNDYGKPVNQNKILETPENVENINRTFKENLKSNPVNTSENGKEIIAYHDAEGQKEISLPPIPRSEGIASVSPPQIVVNEVREEISGPPAESNYIYSEKSQDIEGVVVTAMGIKREQKSLGYASTMVSKNSINKKEKSYSPPPPPPATGKVMTQAYVDQVLNGRVAGLQIAPSNPGSSPQVMIRGMASLTSNNQPLYVIDGIPYQNANLENINPKKIKDVQILKDASATALYGVRGSNGVIVIKTKGLSKKEIDLLNNLQPVQNQESYDEWKENQFESAKANPLSTFSIDVDNASYSNIRRMINNGQKVDKNAVRIEEMINYFKYDYPQPKNNQPFSINTEYNDSPWNPKHKLLKIGLQGKTLNEKELPASNLVFLIDVSGSMNEQNKLPLLKTSFKILLEKLRPQDKVAIVTYAGSAGVVLEPTSAKNKEKILTALENLSAGGSTAGGQGIELAYKLAQENLVKKGNNRVILATDGDFNIGVSDNSELQKLIEEKRKSGIYLTCLGFGMGNYKDNRLEMLADKGNGNYAYIDNMQESNKFLGKEFAGSMYAIAKDVKIQIEFNPKFVKSYRLIGYENRKLKNEDFKNDKIDAGELGIGHTVTAIYEVIPVGSDSEFSPQDVDLKYSKTDSKNEFGDELATVKFRYKNPDEDVSKELIQTIKDSKNQLNNASSDFKFASSVAWFGLVLRQSEFIKDKDLNKIINLSKQGKSNDEDGYRAEFIRLIESYKQIK